MDHKGLPYPFQHIAASWENQIGALVCKTATNACWSKLALVFWSVLTLELLQVFPLPFSTHSSTSWENHQWTSAVGFSIIKFASLFLKMHRRHELESCVCYYWCLQGSRDLINIGSGSLLLVAFWGSGWDFCWSKHLCMPQTWTKAVDHKGLPYPFQHIAALPQKTKLACWFARQLQMLAAASLLGCSGLLSRWSYPNLLVSFWRSVLDING